tara:strand:- start:688 stop:867 length:180 start_codon:yes stop_codon:yes gene_type:complete
LNKETKTISSLRINPQEERIIKEACRLIGLKPGLFSRSATLKEARNVILRYSLKSKEAS